MKKKMCVVLGLVMIIGCMSACGQKTESQTTTEQAVEEVQTEAQVENADSATNETAEYVTYELDTFDGAKVVIDEANIVSQTACDEPLEWEGLPADAEQIAPGRDIVLFANASNYYVEDASTNLVTVATREETEATASNSESSEEVTFSNDDYSITYNTKNFEQFDVNGAVQFCYCNPDVQQAGSNVIIITKEENCTLDDMVETMKSSRSNIEDVYDSVMGSQEIPVKIIVETSDASEGSGLKLVDNVNMLQCGGDVILIESIRTLGPDDETEMTIDGAFVGTLESFILN